MYRLTDASVLTFKPMQRHTDVHVNNNCTRKRIQNYYSLPTEPAHQQHDESTANYNWNGRTINTQAPATNNGYI